MIMLRRYITILMCLMALSAFASTSNNDAEALMDKVVSRLQDAKGVSAHFTLQGDDRSALYMTGQLMMQGKKFYLHTQDMTTWYDGKTMWTYSKSINEVNVSEPSVKELANINPYYTLGYYKKSFVVSELQSEHKGERRICLIPSDRNITISRIIITIATASLAPISFEVTDENATTKITITDYDVNVQLSPQRFVFDETQFPNVDVIDLR